MNNQQAVYFERWVRQEQISYWLIALALIAISVMAFLLFQPDAMNIIETNLGVIALEQAPSLNIFTYIIFAAPALMGLFILYWTSSRENVRALTSNVIHHQLIRWAGLGLVFLALGGMQFFGEGVVLQKVVIAPSMIVFGLFALFRAFKISGFRALGG